VTDTAKTKPTGYVLTVGVNVPNTKRPRIERGESVEVADFPSKTSFEENIESGVIVKAFSPEGTAAIKDAAKGGK
jgi:hypothetical protein